MRRVELFSRNIDILRLESEELKARLAGVHEQIKEFVDHPMLPTSLVDKNVALLRHMETNEATLSEKAVELDEQEHGLMLEQNKVRELLVIVRGKGDGVLRNGPKFRRRDIFGTFSCFDAA